jgi:hypothetical protein
LLYFSAVPLWLASKMVLSVMFADALFPELAGGEGEQTAREAA